MWQIYITDEVYHSIHISSHYDAEIVHIDIIANGRAVVMNILSSNVLVCCMFTIKLFLKVNMCRHSE